MKLFDLKDEIENFFTDHIDAETGEFVGDMDDFNALTEEMEERIEGLILKCKELKAFAEAVDNEEKALHATKERTKREMEGLKGFIASLLNGEKFKTPRCSASYTTSHSVEIDDLMQLPDEFLKYSEPVPDKTAIKKAIAGGETVNGAHIVDKTSIVIK